MTDATLHPVHREDGELVGFVTEEANGWAARTIFGTEITHTGEREDAESYLISHGLSYLADRWEWHDGETWIRVNLLEASPERVSIMITDFGRPDRYGERHTVPAPAPQDLRRL